MSWRIVRAAQLRSSTIVEKYIMGNRICPKCYDYMSFLRANFLDNDCSTTSSSTANSIRIPITQTSEDVIDEVTTQTCSIVVTEVGSGIDSRYDNSNCSITITAL